MYSLKKLLVKESFRFGKEWTMHEASSQINVIFENGHKLTFEINFGGNIGEQKDKWRTKAASTWLTVARKLYNNPTLSEIGNPIQKTWMECFQDALLDEKLKPFSKKQTNLYETIDVPPAQIHHQRQVDSTQFSNDFINFIKHIENNSNTGYKNGRWYPHVSPEGGLLTIAYGHKLTTSDEFKHGITDEQAEKLLKQDLGNAKKTVDNYIQKKYKVKLVLTPKQEEMLVEFAFNLGSLDRFPKFVDAVLRQQWDVVKREYKRKFNSGGKWKELSYRNNAFSKRFLS